VTNRLNGLDSLRACAILLVFQYHYWLFVSQRKTFGWLSELGWTGVDLFFVLSGYLIGDQLFKGIAAGREFSLGRFYARRFLRTLPNFYVVVAAYFLFPAFMGGNEPPPLWRFLTLTQNILLRPGTAFSHAWSLCIEEQFYLLLPLGALLMARVKRPAMAAWIAIGCLMALATAARWHYWQLYGLEGTAKGFWPHIYYNSLTRFDEFLPGVGLALTRHFHPKVWAACQKRGDWFVVAGVAAAIAVSVLLMQGTYFEGYGYGFTVTVFGYPLVAFTFALLTMAALSPGSLLDRCRIPGAQSLALWSFAIYLTHKPIGMILARLFERNGIDRGGPIAVISVTAASLAIGWILYRLVESPIMAWRAKRIPSHFRDPAVARPREVSYGTAL
jgi:peptidoglycan/LPS O-acetylase OafA/YrhL